MENPGLSNSNASDTRTDTITLFQTYYQLQFDRIDKLETKRETFSNLVITLSLAALTFGFSKDVESENSIQVILPIILASLNVIAIIFANKSRYFIKMHQNRASVALEKFAPQLYLINKSIDKMDGNSDFFNRNRLYTMLHWFFILISFCLFILKALPLIYKF